jgi:hypothetical protein
MLGIVTLHSLILFSCSLSFLAGYRWGHLVVKHIRDFGKPVPEGIIFPGQKWHIPRVGDVIVYDVWPETVSYYLVSRRAGVEKEIYTMNRSDFEHGARDETGRDGLGRFQTPVEDRVIKFELREGGKKSKDI